LEREVAQSISDELLGNHNVGDIPVYIVTKTFRDLKQQFARGFPQNGIQEFSILEQDGEEVFHDRRFY
jgi:hypothetical protein